MSEDRQILINRTISRFWQIIPPLWHSLRARIDCEAEQHFNMTSEQFHTLRRISLGIDSVSRLAVDKYISRSAVSRAVDMLVQKQLVQRMEDPDDRRRLQLKLTDKGQAALETTNKQVHEWLADNFNTLDDNDLLRMLESLEKLGQAFPHQRSQTGCR